eukprot:12322-Prorocentrum_minimum.AAC.2
MGHQSARSSPHTSWSRGSVACMLQPAPSESWFFAFSLKLDKALRTHRRSPIPAERTLRPQRHLEPPAGRPRWPSGSRSTPWTSARCRSVERTTHRHRVVGA